ncbi:MAG: tRNA (adenosine(37)-N6)-threonylcarbamoyltransferase complex dimerization subunit type 1 TsaB [Solirubrobacterales bacterium]|nr:tRNA (adenosine(37)-N6)-threonylcarbamoyltransferase complex dimerization subunit type 1 TsaB [Solirubrobacterales bacterium]
MRVLGFDTATRATSVALWDPEGLELEGRDDPAPGQRPRHAAWLMPLIADQLELARLDWDSIDRIAVGVGPGTFTGLRIGVAVARALAQARQIPLVGISTLESLALGARRAAGGEQAPKPSHAVLAVIDARRGEAFAAGWDLDGRPLRHARALTPDALAERTAELGEGVLAVGDGAVEFRSVLERAGAQVPEDRSDLHRVAAINHCRLSDGRPESLPDEIRPDYLRRPDAEIARRPDHRQ